MLVLNAVASAIGSQLCSLPLDITFDEDACQVHKDHAPRNLTTIRKLALGLISREPTKMSLKRKKAARDDAYLISLIA